MKEREYKRETQKKGRFKKSRKKPTRPKAEKGTTLFEGDGQTNNVDVKG